MKNELFKFRERFDFAPNQYEIGRPIFRNEFAGDNFFILKILTITEDHYDNLYFFHLNHFTREYPSHEKFFFDTVLEIITLRIKYYEIQDPFSSKHKINNKALEALKAFRTNLAKHDKWGINKPIDKILLEKNEEIENLKIKIKAFESQIKFYQLHEPSEKIRISKGSMASFMDLLRQVQHLQQVDGSRLLSFQGYSSWYKLVSKYFVHGEREIPIATAQNYFSPETSSKHTQINSRDKIFKIVSKKK